MTTLTAGSTLPRFGTQRNLERDTLGPEVAEVVRRLGYEPMPWQQHLLDVAYELDDDGQLYYGEVNFLAPRQQGKTLVSFPAAVHRSTFMARRYGSQRTTYTAQKRQSARKKLERDFAEMLRRSQSFSEVTNPKRRPQRATDWKQSLNNGSEHIQIGKSYFQIDAPTRTGTHGDTLDLGQIDEAFAHQDDAVETAMRPAQLTRWSPQLWVFSTAGDAKSTYLWRKVLAGRKACEDGTHGRVAYFEYSADDDDDPGDPATWRRTMPALDITITEARVAAEWETAVRKGPDGIALFRRSYLCQWPDVPVLEDVIGEGVLPAALWSAPDPVGCMDEHSQPGRTVVFAVDSDPEQAWASIAMASVRGDGKVHVEVVDRRQGTAWLRSRVAELRSQYGGRWVRAKNSTAGALDLGNGEWEDLAASDVTAACVKILELVSHTVLRHRDQPDLNAAVTGSAKKKIGDSWRFDRVHASADITPLYAVTFAAYVAAGKPIAAPATAAAAVAQPHDVFRPTERLRL